MFTGFGTIINTGAIIVGGLLGLIIGKNFNKKLSDAAMTALGLFILVLGIQMSFKSNNLMLVLLSLIIGSIVGEILKIDDLLVKFSIFLENKFAKKNGDNKFGKAFITCSLLYCVGPMIIIGSLNDGLNGDYSLLITKAMMDGITSVLFVATMSIGAIFAAIPVFVIQILLTLLAGALKFLLSPEIIAEISGTGGIIIVGSGLNLLGLKKIKLANMLPALIIAIIINIIFSGGL